MAQTCFSKLPGLLPWLGLPSPQVVEDPAWARPSAWPRRGAGTRQSGRRRAPSRRPVGDRQSSETPGGPFLRGRRFGDVQWRTFGFWGDRGIVWHEETPTYFVEHWKGSHPKNSSKDVQTSLFSQATCGRSFREVQYLWIHRKSCCTSDCTSDTFVSLVIMFFSQRSKLFPSQERSGEVSSRQVVGLLLGGALGSQRFLGKFTLVTGAAGYDLVCS